MGHLGFILPMEKQFNKRNDMVKTKKFTTLIVVDASGSMSDKIAEVVGGLKQIFSDVKKDAAEHQDVEMTTIIVDFSHSKDIRIIIKSNDPNVLTDELAASYATRGATALYDAIGYAFGLVPTEQDGVFVTIITDGQENDSKEFTSETLRKLIEAKRGEGWAITFMGTTEAAVQDAVKFGVSLGNTMTFMDSGTGVETAMRMSSETRGAYYTSNVVRMTSAKIDTDNLIVNAQSAAVGSSLVVDDTSGISFNVTDSADTSVTISAPIDTTTTE